MFECKITRRDIINCLLCKDAPCSAACDKLDPAGLLRSISFDNEKTAAASLVEGYPCKECDSPCERACIRAGKVPIRETIRRLNDEVRPLLDIEMPSDESRLKTEFCGKEIENPFFLSSSVVAGTYDKCARAFEAGWAGVSFKTICTFDIHETSPRYSAVKGGDGSMIGFKNIEQLSVYSVKENMETFRRLKEDYPSKFILASIMGQDEEEWEYLSRICEENGADAIELNMSCPNMIDETLGSVIGQVPEQVERYTAAARRGTSLPILAKLTPNVASLSPFVQAAVRGGADGITAINTIKSITGVDPHTYIAAPAVHGMSAVGGYSGKAVKPVALRFISEAACDPSMKDRYISGVGGIETWKDALEFILLGAGNVQVTTAVMQYGYRIIDDLKAGLNYYLAEKGINDLSEIRGIALDTISDTTEVLERDTIVFPKFLRDRCVGCGRCEISCSDGGHQAIRLNDQRRPVMEADKCVGCHLCVLVCPESAIIPGRKRIYRETPSKGGE